MEKAKGGTSARPRASLIKRSNRTSTELGLSRGVTVVAALSELTKCSLAATIARTTASASSLRKRLRRSRRITSGVGIRMILAGRRRALAAPRPRTDGALMRSASPLAPGPIGIGPLRRTKRQNRRSQPVLVGGPRVSTGRDEAANADVSCVSSAIAAYRSECLLDWQVPIRWSPRRNTQGLREMIETT